MGDGKGKRVGREKVKKGPKGKGDGVGASRITRLGLGYSVPQAQAQAQIPSPVPENMLRGRKDSLSGVNHHR